MEKAARIPLKKVCANVDIDPKIARRVLRERMKRPNGRWDWTLAQSKKVEAILLKHKESNHGEE